MFDYPESARDGDAEGSAEDDSDGDSNGDSEGPTDSDSEGAAECSSCADSDGAVVIYQLLSWNQPANEEAMFLERSAWAGQSIRVEGWIVLQLV